MITNNKTGNLLKIDDASIYFEISGCEGAQPLVLLHGGMGCSFDFNTLLPTLAEKHKIISIDSRGHGRSTLGNEGLSYQRLEQDVIEVLRHLGIEQTAIIGFSDGGTVGYRLMASSIIKVTKLATIGAPFELKSDDQRREIFSRITGESWREKFPSNYESYQSLNPSPDFDRLVKSTVSMWLDSNGYPRDAVNNLEGDVLVLRGDNDYFFNRVEAVELANRIKKSSFMNIAFAGHAAHEDQANIVLLSLKAFFENKTENN